LDKATQKILAKGARLVELLKQGQYAPVTVEKQVVSIFTGTNDYLETIPVHDVKRFEKEFLEFVELKYNSIFERIKIQKDLSQEVIQDIRSAVEEFIPKFKTTEKIA